MPTIQNAYNTLQNALVYNGYNTKVNHKLKAFYNPWIDKNQQTQLKY